MDIRNFKCSNAVNSKRSEDVPNMTRGSMVPFRCSFLNYADQWRCPRPYGGCAVRVVFSTATFRTSTAIRCSIDVCRLGIASRARRSTRTTPSWPAQASNVRTSVRLTTDIPQPLGSFVLAGKFLGFRPRNAFAFLISIEFYSEKFTFLYNVFFLQDSIRI